MALNISNSANSAAIKTELNKRSDREDKSSLRAFAVDNARKPRRLDALSLDMLILDTSILHSLIQQKGSKIVLT